MSFGVNCAGRGMFSGLFVENRFFTGTLIGIGWKGSEKELMEIRRMAECN